MSYIAYVEDDEEDIEIFKDLYCSQSPFPVTYFSDGQKLKQHLQGAQALPCLILLDMANPVQSGTETIAFLQSGERLKHIPLILFSSSIKSIELDKYSHEDVSILEKPSSLQEWEQACTIITESCRRGTGKTAAYV